MMITRMVLIIAILGLSACASSPRYVPADHPGDYGHYSHKISENRYRVNFNGNRRTDLQETRDYALLRAAELTLANDYEWFQIIDRETSTRESDSYEPRLGFGYQRTTYVERNCGLVGCTQTSYPSTYASTRFETGRPVEKHSHSIEIVMGKGEMPEDGNYYDAAVVAKTIFDRI